MLSNFKNRRAVVAVLLSVLLVACGGGGSDPAPSGSTPPVIGTTDPTAPPGSDAAPDAIPSSALSANLCAAPRTGIDPFTGRLYPDKSGNVTQEKSWVRAWIDETYLWFDEIPASIKAANFTTPQAFFDALRTPALTASGKPRDRFHFLYPTAVWRALNESGIESGYGFELAILKSQVPRDVRVAYTEPGSPAAQAGIGRGVKILGVDGVDVETTRSVDVLNGALFPAAPGQGHIFKLQELDGTVRLVVLTSASITKTPVQNVKTLDTPAGKVGYLQFNDHIATSEVQLISAMSQLKDAGVQDLVLDIRYNGGGLLDIASELAFMIASPAATKNATFERLLFNRKNPFQLTDAETVTPFHAVSQGFSVREGQALPQLGLSRVTVLTSEGTCSASESIINGLRGIDVKVTQIGNTTCGKPYGFLPQDNCGTTYFAIQFKGVNNQGFGDYADGIAPTCVVADDFGHALGDPAEARLAAALSYRATGTCPATATGVAKASVLGTGEPLLSGKSLARSGRFLRDGAMAR